MTIENLLYGFLKAGYTIKKWKKSKSETYRIPFMKQGRKFHFLVHFRGIGSAQFPSGWYITSFGLNAGKSVVIVPAQGIDTFTIEKVDI